MFVASERTGWSSAKVGRYFGGYDHNTVLSAYHMVDKRLKQRDEQTTTLVEQLRAAPAIAPLTLEDHLRAAREQSKPKKVPLPSSSHKAPRYDSASARRGYAQKQSQIMLEALLVERGVLRTPVASSGSKV